MTIDTLDQEKILSLDRLGSLLQEVTCGESVTLIFRDDAAFQRATNSWAWVNQYESRTFILLISPPFCGLTDRREVFQVQTTTVQRRSLQIQLHGAKREWGNLSNTLTMDFGVASHQSPEKRDISISFSRNFGLPFKVDLTGRKYGVKDGEYAMDFECSDCVLSGALSFTARLVVIPLKGKIDEFSLTITPKDIRAAAKFSVHGEGTVPLQLSHSLEIIKIAIPGLGFSILNIVTVGAVAKSSYGVTLTNWKGKSTIRTGSSISIPNDSRVKVDIAGKGKSEVKGWKPQIDKKPLEISGEVSADLETFIYYGVGVEISVFNKGVEAGLKFRLPEISTTIRAGRDSAGACKPVKQDWVSVESKIGAALVFEAGKKGALEVVIPIKRRSDGVANNKRDIGAVVQKELWVSSKCMVVFDRFILTISSMLGPHYIPLNVYQQTRSETPLQPISPHIG